jgi:predicted transcriptional regulator
MVAHAEQRRGHGDLAQAVLDLVSQAAAPVTPAHVRDALGADLAYTTVMTVLARLHDRGLLARKRTGRAFAYTAIGDPTNVTARRMHRLLDVEADRAGALARFVDGLNADDEQLLRSLLDQITTDQAAADEEGPSGGDGS